MLGTKPIPLIAASRRRPIALIRGAAAACLAVVAVAILSAQAIAPTDPQPSSWQKMDIGADWHFQTDAKNIGSAQGWAGGEFDDSAWRRVSAGHPWEEQGFPDYDGYAWYRRWVTAPAAWRGWPVYLWLAGLDDEAELFVNGQPLGHFGDRGKGNSANRDINVVDLSGVVRPSEPFLVAVRINDWGGTGGLTMLPAAIATSRTALYTPEQHVLSTFQRYPDLAWPYWLRDNRGAVRQRGAAWAMTGTEGGTAKALLGLDSTIMPAQDAFAITAWLYDPLTAKLHAPTPSTVKAASANGNVPVFNTSWRAEDISITSDFFVTTVPSSRDRGEDVAFYSLKITNESDAARKPRLILALRPYGVAGKLTRIDRLQRQGNVILANGAAAVVADRAPDDFGASPLEGGDIAVYANSGGVPPAQDVRDVKGLATGALLYSLDIGPRSSSTLTFKMPQHPTSNQMSPAALREVDFAVARDRALSYWDNKLGGIRLSLPDRRYSDAYYASLANLLMARNGDWLMPGPSIHRRFWYRDATYLSLALLNAGRADIVAPVLEQMKSGQLKSGEFPPVLDVDGRAPSQQHEWDAQGEGIFALVNYYRWTGDIDWLRKAYPTVRSAAAFLRDLRSGHEGGDILPPSESAEDLGPADWHHYWDDFWAIAGLQQAKLAAEKLGERDDVQWMAGEEAALRAGLARSIEAVRQAKGIDYIPNGPEDTDSSAMARGTTPAIWPAGGYDAADPLLRRSFEVYYDRWIAPNNGAYRHYAGAFWPFAGLQLAHVYLILDMPEKVQPILDWTLAHETFPGLGVWADSVSSSTNRLVDGDMPHAWFAAELTLLLHDMLVRAEGGRLDIGSYLPPSWYDEGQRVAVAGLPTLYGPAGFELVSHAVSGYWDLSLEDTASPPAGFRWKIPAALSIERVIVDGRDWTSYDRNGISLPADTRTVRLYAKR